MNTFRSGAKSAEVKPRYDLIVDGARRGAQRMAEGAASHGERNYERGVDDAAFVKDRENHMVEHALLYAAGDRSTDHLGAVVANAAILARLEAMRDSRILNGNRMPSRDRIAACGCAQGDGCGQ